MQGVVIAALIYQHIKDREYDRVNGPSKVVAKFVEGLECKVCSRKWRVSDCCEKKASWTSSRPSSTIPFTRTS